MSLLPRSLPRFWVLVSCLCGLLGVLAFWPMTYLGFFLPKLVFLSFSMGIFMALLASDEASFGRLTVLFQQSLFRLVLLYFAVLAFFICLSQAPLSSLFGISSAAQGGLVVLLYLALFFAGASLKKKDHVKVFHALIGLNALVVLYGFLQILQLDPFGFLWNEASLSGRVFSFFGNPNWLASFLLLTAPLLLWRPRFLTKVLFVANLILLGFTLSKAAWMACLVLAFIFMWRYLQGRREKVFFGIALLLCAALGFGFLWLYYGDSFQVFRSLNARWIIWKDTWVLLQNFPWGHGLDTFRLFYPKVLSPELWEFESISANIEAPHQHVLQLLFELGPVGFFVFGCLWLGLLWRTFKLADSPLFFLSAGLLAYVLSLQFGFEVLSTGALFWIFAGMIIGGSPRPLQAVKPNQLLRGSLLLLSCSLFMVSFVALQHWRANLHFENAQALREGAFYSESVLEYELAKRQYPYDLAYQLSFAEAVLSSENPSLAWLEEVEHSLNEVDVLTAGLEPNLPILRAWLAVHRLDEEGFQKELALALKLNPSSFSTYRLGSALAEQMGNEVLAQQLRAKLMELLPSFWNQPETEAGRIFQKNNPWLEDFN